MGFYCKNDLSVVEAMPTRGATGHVPPAPDAAAYAPSRLQPAVVSHSNADSTTPSAESYSVVASARLLVAPKVSQEYAVQLPLLALG